MAFCAAIATAVVLGACGSGIPGNAVVQIGDASITTTALDHWLAVANDTNQASTGVAAPPLPLPPDYKACVAPSRRGSSAAAAKTSCAQDYQALLKQILPFLIQTIWIQGEAVDRGVKVSNAKLESSFQQARDAANPPLKTTAEMNSFLAKSGETIADLKWCTLRQAARRAGSSSRCRSRPPRSRSAADRRLLQEESRCADQAGDAQPASRRDEQRWRPPRTSSRCSRADRATRRSRRSTRSTRRPRPPAARWSASHRAS